MKVSVFRFRFKIFIFRPFFVCFGIFSRINSIDRSNVVSVELITPTLSPLEGYPGRLGTNTNGSRKSALPNITLNSIKFKGDSLLRHREIPRTELVDNDR